ncbi:hypothetical protein LTR95_015166, partial [Oleoguttula sp. CCFEE 5521]
MQERTDRVETLVDLVTASESSESCDSAKATPAVGATAHGTRSYSTHAISSSTRADIKQAAVGMGKLKLKSSGSTRWVDASNWESMLEDVLHIRIADVKSYLANLDLAEDQQDSYGGPSLSTLDGIPTIDPVLGAPMTLSLTDIIKAIPPREVVDRLIAAWFNAEDPARGECKLPGDH